MGFESDSRYRATVKPATLCIAIVLMLIAATVVSAQHGDSRQRPQIGLEINLPHPTSPRFRLAGPYGGGGMILRRDVRITDQKAAGEFTALDVRAEVEGDAMKVTLSIIYNDLSDQEWWKDKKVKLVGSYLIRTGETVRSLELDQFGIEPFEIKALDASPVVLKPGEGPRITETPSLKVDRLEKHLNGYRLWLKNRSDKNIVAYTVSAGRTGLGTGSASQGGTLTVLAAGGRSTELHFDESEVEGSGIEITFVMFDDGSFEGDPKSATQFLAVLEGVRVQSPSVLRMVEETLKVDDSDLRTAFIKLESELWVIPEALDKPSSIQFLKTRFPDRDEKTLYALYEVFKGGLYDARNIALSVLGETGRQVQTLEEHAQYASAVESIRRTLERLRETFRKITSAQR